MCEGEEKQGAPEQIEELEKRVEALEEQLKKVIFQVDHLETRIIQFGAGK